MPTINQILDNPRVQAAGVDAAWVKQVIRQEVRNFEQVAAREAAQTDVDAALAAQEAAVEAVTEVET